MREKLLSNYLFLILLGVISIFSGCAKSMQAYRIPEKEVAPETSRIFIIRPSILVHSIKQEVYENNTIAGQVGARSYLAWDTKPGTITLQGPWGFFKVLAQPGKTYYFKLRPKTFGFGRKAFLFMPISEEEGKGYLEKQNLKAPIVKVVT